MGFKQSVTFITSTMEKKKRNANKSRRMLSKKKPHLKIIKVVYLQKVNRWEKWIHVTGSQDQEIYSMKVSKKALSVYDDERLNWDINCGSETIFYCYLIRKWSKKRWTCTSSLWNNINQNSKKRKQYICEHIKTEIGRKG